MAMEYKLPITASELKEKILSIDKKVELINGKIPTEYLPENIGVQADHAQNDDTQPDYIKNRIAYSDGVKDVIVFNQTLTFDFVEDMSVYMSMIELSDEDIAFWKNLGDINIIWDGTSYEVPKMFYSGINCWGNIAFLGMDSTGEPFVVALEERGRMLLLLSLTDPAPDDPENAPTIDHTIEISYQKDNTYVDPKYFNIDNILTVKSGDVIHDKTKYIFELDEDMGIGILELEGKFFLPSAGKKIKVYWDGVEYPCTVTAIPESDGMFGVGSIDAIINENLSLAVEPFIIATDNTEYYMIYSLGADPVHELYIVADDEYQTTIDGKYLDVKLAYDEQPTSDSNNLLTSDAIYRALGYRSYISIDGSVYEGSNNPVSSNAVYNALGGRSVLTIENSVNMSDNPISSNAVYTALGNVSSISVQHEVNNYSSNPVSSRAVYTALKNIDLSSKQDKINVTSSDNGKFMRVVDGEWAAVAMPNAEEALF